MKYVDFLNSKPAQKAAEAFTASHGGRFVGEEPGDRLVYSMEDGEAAYTPPEGSTVDSVLRELQSGKPLPDLWPELEYDPALEY